MSARAQSDDPPVRQRILLAEDEALTQDVVSYVLSREGYLVDVVANGQDALTAARDADYALVLMDVRMPVLDGTEATRRIRALASNRARVPIIAMTASTFAEYQAKLIGVGMDDYVMKPVDPGMLLDCVRRHLA